jgi:uncharacterized damage-inducible protein DinB
MNKQQLLAQREYFNMVHGVTVRAISAFADEELDFRPRPGMRTPRELIFHIYTQEKVLAEAAHQGRFNMEAADLSNPESPAAASALGALATVRDARTYAESCHDAAEAAVKAMSDDELRQPVASPFGTYPAWRYFGFAQDEHWHHRGQLYTYLRLLGREPPMLYDYGTGES